MPKERETLNFVCMPVKSDKELPPCPHSSLGSCQVCGVAVWISQEGLIQAQKMVEAQQLKGPRMLCLNCSQKEMKIAMKDRKDMKLMPVSPDQRETLKEIMGMDDEEITRREKAFADVHGLKLTPDESEE